MSKRPTTPSLPCSQSVIRLTCKMGRRHAKTEPFMAACIAQMECRLTKPGITFLYNIMLRLLPSPQTRGFGFRNDALPRSFHHPRFASPILSAFFASREHQDESRSSFRKSIHLHAEATLPHTQSIFQTLWVDGDQLKGRRDKFPGEESHSGDIMHPEDLSCFPLPASSLPTLPGSLEAQQQQQQQLWRQESFMTCAAPCYSESDFFNRLRTRTQLSLQLTCPLSTRENSASFANFILALFLFLDGRWIGAWQKHIKCNALQLETCFFVV